MDFISCINAVAERLKQPLPGIAAQQKMAPELRNFPFSNYNEPVRDSSVLILLYPVNNDLFTVFIKRTVYNGVHSGQVSLPGGKNHHGETPLETALREASEEIGINASVVNILGNLTPLFIPVSHSRVLPFVGYSFEKPAFIPDPREVEYLIELPVSVFFNPANCKEVLINLNNLSVKAPVYLAGKDYIWGATAMIMAEFAEIFPVEILK